MKWHLPRKCKTCKSIIWPWQSIWTWRTVIEKYYYHEGCYCMLKGRKKGQTMYGDTNEK